MKLLILDGNSILNRAFYGIKILSTKDGQFTNGIYGFLTMLQKVMNDIEPDRVAIAFDMKAPTFRHKAYNGYKAQRKGMPEELAQQMPILKELLTYLGYKLVECEGYEADDILGTLSLACENSGNECIIATGDRDSLQLISDKTSVRLLTTKFGTSTAALYDQEKIREEYGLTPKQLIDVKAIQGDSSDNIPGVAGIGPKGATELIRNFGSLSGVYEHLDDERIKPKMREKLEADKENAQMSYFLGTICREAPVNTDLEQYRIEQPQEEKARKLMIRLELFSLMDKLIRPEEIPVQEESLQQANTILYDDGAAILTKIEDFGQADFLFRMENGRITSFLFNIGNYFYDVKNDPAFFRAFCGLTVPKRTYNSKDIYKAAIQENFTVKNLVMDAEIAGYVLNPSAADYTVLRTAVENDLVALASDDKQVREISVLPSVCDRLQEKLEENHLTSLFSDIEMPLVEVLAEMEVRGFSVDKDGIQNFGNHLGQEILELEQNIYDQVGYTFNINSPKQLGDALFVKLALPHGKKTKSGYSTNAEVLENLRYDHPVVEDILRYRAFTKLKSTYCDGLLKEIAEDGRIHSNFKQTETRTGRISSTEPNLQNIPVRTEEGRELRRFFRAEDGNVLIDADYSQIELRVLAHAAQDINMINAFIQNDDIHRATAAQVFHMPEEMVSPQMRSRAKAVNFGIVYGIGAFSLAKDIGVTRREAEQYIHQYLAHYNGVRDYMEKAVEDAKEKGYAETLFGRRRYLQELVSSNFNLRSFGERVAKNMPIQGTAADIIKIAMIRVSQRLKKEKMRAKLILQVHDELIVEAPESEAQRAAEILAFEMENAVKLLVPIPADANIGKTWYDAKG